MTDLSSEDSYKFNILSTLQKKNGDAIGPKFPFRLERGRYTVRTIGLQKELEEVLRLRYRVFSREYGIQSANAIDIDDLDFLCDHLIVTKDEKIIGTYRLISSAYSQLFYSQREFQMDPFFNLAGNKLELGRLCIHEEYRNGVVISLLWKGVIEYARMSGSRYLFGCSSIRTTDLLETAVIVRHMMDQNFTMKELSLGTQPDYRVHRLQDAIDSLDRPGFERDAYPILQKIPPLLTSYLKAGAKVFAEPALDAEFSCIDFLTVFEPNQMSEFFGRRYQI